MPSPKRVNIDVNLSDPDDHWVKEAVLFLQKSTLPQHVEFTGRSVSQIAKRLLEKALSELGVTREDLEGGQQKLSWD